MDLFDGSGLSFIFTTIARNACARRLIDSALAIYPRLTILVADQNRPSEAMTAFYRDRGVQAHWVPFDHGVSAGRALLAAKVETPFLVFGDDDFVFTERTRFQPAMSYLRDRPRTALVTGAMVDLLSGPNGPRVLRRRYESFLYRDEARRGLVAVPIDHVRPKVEVHEGELFYDCDIGLNWAMARRSLFDDPRLLWDPIFKTNGEHENFFLQLMQVGAGRVAYCPAMECEHVSESPPEYLALRSRDEGWARFARKWSLDWLLYVGKSLHDFVNQPSGPVKFQLVGQDYASHLPPRHSDYLRVWANGWSAASTSGAQVLKDARDETRAARDEVRAARRNSEQRIHSLTARLEKNLAENQRLTGVIGDLRAKLAAARAAPAGSEPPPNTDALLAELARLREEIDALKSLGRTE